MPEYILVQWPLISVFLFSFMLILSPPFLKSYDVILADTYDFNMSACLRIIGTTLLTTQCHVFYKRLKNVLISFLEVGFVI